MRSIFTFLFLTVATACFAQKRDTLFITGDGTPVSTSDSAEYVRIISQPDTKVKLYLINDYFKSGKLQMTAQATSLKPEKLEGEVTYYYENGNKEAISSYKNGRLSGLNYNFYPNGKPYFTLTYLEKEEKSTDPEYLITANFDLSGAVLVTEGNGYYKEYDDDFKSVYREGAVKNGKPIGLWKSHTKYYDRTETHDENGKIISGTTKNNGTGEFKTYTKNSQNQTIFLYKNDGTTTTNRDSADYFRVVDELNPTTELYNVTELYKSGKTKLTGKSVYDDFAYYEGPVTSYFENGQRSKINIYKSGYLIDEQYEFFPNGKPYTTKKYDHEYNPKVAPHFVIIASYDSLGVALVTDGNGYYKEYDDSFKYIYKEGPIKNGKTVGEWKFQNDDLIRSENYDDSGKLISGKATRVKTGETKTYTQHEVLPTFPGGNNEFGKYLGNTIIYPETARQRNIQGRVLVTFVVEQSGRVTNVKTVNQINPALDREAIRVIENSPIWIPGIQYGFPVRAQYTVPISFNLH